MKLTQAEFKLLNDVRPRQWTLKEYGTKVYHTLTLATEVKLFWLEFFTQVFHIKFKNQKNIHVIQNFDMTQPVLIDDELNLKLPSYLESVAFFADNKQLPVVFNSKYSMLTILLSYIVAVLTLVFTNIFIFSKMQPTSVFNTRLI